MKAIDIIWDVDHEEDRELLPTEIEIPSGMEDEDEISDYLSDATGFCHRGYKLVDEAIQLSKADILKEIKKLTEEDLHEAGDNIGYTMPDGRYHIFIELDDIGNSRHGEELIYRIEPNVIDEYGAAEPMADVYTADFGDFAELLLGCVWCMEQFDADLEQSKDLAAANRVEVDLGYATLVAEKGTNPDYKEVYVGLENKDGLWTQDLAIIGGKYHYSKEDEVVQDKGVSVKVYSDKDDEDITHEFSIGIYEPEEESKAAVKVPLAEQIKKAEAKASPDSKEDSRADKTFE